MTSGLIDCHWHETLVSVSQIAALTQDIAFVHLVAGQEAGATLLRGFTTVRDTGGPVFGLKMAIDRSVVAGPRDPYMGRLGVSAEGAHADILVWDGGPETVLSFLDDPANNLRLVMKGGRVFKETL